MKKVFLKPRNILMGENEMEFWKSCRNLFQAGKDFS